MNDTQKAELKCIVAGDFGALSDIFDAKKIPTNIAKQAYDALKGLLMGTDEVLKSSEAQFQDFDIFLSMKQIQKIIKHPHPQNRYVGKSGIYTVTRADNSLVGVQMLVDGVDSVHGFVYWNDPEGQREQRRELRGILGLTAKQEDTQAPLTKDTVLKELELLIDQSYRDYLESKNAELESKSLQQELGASYPQLEVSPTQLTCPLTGKIFDTPVLLITCDNQCSGKVEKERALAIINASQSGSEPKRCPLTRKPLFGFVVCKTTQAMANEFWEKYQAGEYSGEFLRYKPSAESSSIPDCYFVPRNNQPNSHYLWRPQMQNRGRLNNDVSSQSNTRPTADTLRFLRESFFWSPLSLPGWMSDNPSALSRESNEGRVVLNQAGANSGSGSARQQQNALQNQGSQVFRSAARDYDDIYNTDYLYNTVDDDPQSVRSNDPEQGEVRGQSLNVDGLSNSGNRRPEAEARPSMSLADLASNELIVDQIESILRLHRRYELIRNQIESTMRARRELSRLLLPSSSVIFGGGSFLALREIVLIIVAACVAAAATRNAENRAQALENTPVEERNNQDHSPEDTEESEEQQSNTPKL